MFRAIGFVIILYSITQMLAEPFQAFEDAVVATFQVVEVAATVSERQLVDLSEL